MTRPRGRPPGTPGNKTRYTGPARSASPTVKALFDTIAKRSLSVKYDVAPRVGITPVSLSRHRTGVTTPNILAIEEIAAALGLRIVLMPASSVSSADTGRMADGKAE